MKDKSPWNGYAKPSFHILNFSSNIICTSPNTWMPMMNGPLLPSPNNVRMNYYFVRIIDEWNSLPNDIKETVGISSFKHKVMSFLSNTYT